MKTQYLHESDECAAILRVYTEDREADILTIITSTDQRGKGYGRALMREILADADAEGFTLLLNAGPGRAKGLSTEQLESWYERMGFNSISMTEHGTRRMERPPGVASCYSGAHG